MIVAAAPARAQKRYPERSCVACRTSRQKRELIRVVRTPDGRMEWDETGRAAGRGAYLCAAGDCWQTAVRRQSLQRALGVPMPADLRERLTGGPALSTVGSTNGRGPADGGADTNEREDEREHERRET